MDPLDELNKASRSVRVSIHNSTSKKLVLKSHPIITGSWKVAPPESISPLSTVEFGTEGNLLQGTEAGSIYVLEGKENEGQFEFFWNNPGFGKKGFRRVSPAGYESEYRSTETHNCVLSFTVKEVGTTMKDVDEIEREINDITVMINETENVIKGTTKMLQVYQSQNDMKQVKLVETTITSKTKHLEDLKQRKETQIKEIERIRSIESDPKAMEKILSTIRENIESAVKARKGMEHMRELYEKQKDVKSLEGLDKQIEMKKNETELLRKKEQKVIQKVIELKKSLGLGNTMAPGKKRMVAMYDYTKNSEDEIDLKAGDVIEIVQDDNPDWYGGLLNGKMGYFPKSFVSELNIGINGNGGATDVTGVSKDGVNGAVEESEDFSSLYPKARVIYEHQPSDDTQISLAVGEIITVYSWEDDYWWDGCNSSGKVGYFPQENVDWIEPEDDQVQAEAYSYYESSGDDNTNNSNNNSPQPPVVQPVVQPVAQPKPVSIVKPVTPNNTSPTPTPTSTTTPNRQTLTAPVLKSVALHHVNTNTSTSPPQGNNQQQQQDPPKPPQKRELPNAPKVSPISPVNSANNTPTSVTPTFPTLPIHQTPTPLPHIPTSHSPSPSSSSSSFEKLLQPILSDLTKKLVESHQKETAALNQKIASLEKELKDLKDSKGSSGTVISKASPIRKY